MRHPPRIAFMALSRAPDRDGAASTRSPSPSQTGPPAFEQRIPNVGQANALPRGRQLARQVLVRVSSGLHWPLILPGSVLPVSRTRRTSLIARGRTHHKPRRRLSCRTAVLGRTNSRSLDPGTRMPPRHQPPGCSTALSDSEPPDSMQSQDALELAWHSPRPLS